MERPSGKLSAAELFEKDKKHHLHPFTHHGDMYSQGMNIIQSAEGVYVTDANGRKFLDGLAGLWCVNVGYGRKEIADAVYRQMNEVAYYPSFFNSTTEPTILLAEKLGKLAPGKLKKVFFSNSGSESNESALKLIRAYQKLKGTPSKSKILTLSFGYHGVTVATTSMTHIPSCQTPFNLPLDGFISVPGPYHYGAKTDLSKEDYLQWCLHETERVILKEHPNTIAAMFVEPVQGAGGVIVPTVEYLVALRELCRQHRILFVADEVITGFGRLGAWFASQLWNLDPDLMTVAKGLTSGYLPLGATFLTDEIADTLMAGGYLAHGYTYSGHPASCAAGLANLEIMEKENLVKRTYETTGPYFQKKLQELKSHPAAAEIRGVGLIGAIELVPRGGKAALSPNTPLGPKAMKFGREEGIIIRGIRDILAMAPPLTIQESEIDFLFKGVARVLDRIWG